MASLLLKYPGTRAATPALDPSRARAYLSLARMAG